MRSSAPQPVITVLPTGLKVVCRQCPGAEVEYCGAVVKVGSRDDGELSPGMAHFVEHTIFKGTRKRSSFHIINRMERVGGELNAYTTKEETVVYTAAPRGNVARAMELLADLATSSRFPAAELDKEREVVEDEINSYLDTPSEAVYDDFEDLIFAGTPLGHNILGTSEALATFDSDMCQRYLSRWYTTANMVVFYYGPASPQRVLPIVSRCFETLPQAEAEHHSPDICATVASRQPFSTFKRADTHQAHTVMGAVTGGLYAPGRYPMALLTNILGGPGMNSLLNVELREKRGLVYSVDASSSLLSDCGLFTIYFGCDPADQQRCEEIVRKQIEQVAAGCITAKQLQAAKKQYIGQLAVASDNRESVAIATGRAAMYFPSVMPSSQVAERINAVTTEQIMEAAAGISQRSMLCLKGTI